MLVRFVLPIMLIIPAGCNTSETTRETTTSAQHSPDKRIADAETPGKEAKPAEEKPLAENRVAEELVATKMTALATKNYWDRCVEINSRFVSERSEIWFKEFRPSSVEAVCREAARRLRELDTSNVDPEVVDHVNRAIRGYETIAAIAKVKGQESLLRDASDTLIFIYRICRNSNSGAFADGGWLEMGVGFFAGGQKATSEGQEQTRSIASSIIESEERVIKLMRQKYGIELRPW